MKRLYFIFFSLGLFFCFWVGNYFLAGNLEKDIQKIKEASFPRAFRCVLDSFPRMLVIQVSPQVFVAYDTENCLYRLSWIAKNPEKAVKLTGAVYDGKHGPQPLRKGIPLFINEEQEFFSPKTKMHYLGYIDDGFKKPIRIRFALIDTKTKKTRAILESSLEISQQKSVSYLRQKIKAVSLKRKEKVYFIPSSTIQWQKSNGQVAKKTYLANKKEIEFQIPLPIQ